MANTKPDPKAVAREFAKVLREWLSKEEMAKVIKFNEESGDKYGTSVCHSHDFCDANMVMEEAFHNLKLDTLADLPDEDEAKQKLELDYEGDRGAPGYRAGMEKIRQIEADRAASSDLWNEAWTIAKRADFDPAKIG